MAEARITVFLGPQIGCTGPMCDKEVGEGVKGMSSEEKISVLGCQVGWNDAECQL